MNPESVAVLCVDDDSSFLDLTATCLGRECDEFVVYTESSVNDGLDRLGQEDIDCIVSDYEMPGKDGLDFLEAVREDDPDLPFILFTGKGSEDIAGDAIKAGVTSYLQKENGLGHYTVLANGIKNSVAQYRTQRRADALKQEYELVAETATDAFWVIDPETKVLSMSGAIAQFGHEPDQDSDVEWFLEHLHPDDRERIRQQNDALLAREPEAFDELTVDRGTFSEEYRFQRADGTYAHCKDRGIVVFDGDRPVKMVGTMTDITEQKEREQELQATRSRIELALESSDAHLWEWYPDSDTATLYPSTPDTFVGEVESHADALKHMHPDDRQRVTNALMESIESADSFSVEFRTITEDEVRWQITEGRAYEDEQRGSYVLGVTKDITEQKSRERELEQKTERLDRFASVLSHDLRNPLGVAQGYLELTQEECDNAHVDKVADALDRVDSIVEDVLTLARDGDAVTAREEVSLRAVAEKAWQGVERETVALEVAEMKEPLACDPDRVRRALENLFRNAVQHGGNNVTVRIGPLAGGGGFYVEDDGAGFAVDADELFEWGCSTDKGGTGFGLTIVEQIVEAHGWTITATNGETGGARFEIRRE